MQSNGAYVALEASSEEPLLGSARSRKLTGRHDVVSLVGTIAWAERSSRREQSTR